MSTNNNHFSRSEKEVKPKWKSEEDSLCKFVRLSGSKVQEKMSNRLTDCNAVTLSERGIREIADMDHFSTKLRRLDLSKNKLGRLACFQSLGGVSMLNASDNELQGDSSLEELRYLVELRTLNISNNPKIKGLRSHIIKPISKLQALIATNCGFTKLGFLRHCQDLNTLVLSKNQLQVWVPSDVGALEKLQKISLGYNQLKVVPDLHLCVSLTEIRLNSNLIEEIDDRFVRFASSRVKTLDLSSNRISQWEQVQKLKAITTMTNLGIKGNPLPAPPVSKEELGKTLKEDLALAKGKVDSEEEQHVRQHVLVLFQREVGKEKKVFEQLIVLDQKRVKVKWTQGGAGAVPGKGTKRGREADAHASLSTDKGDEKKPKKKRGRKPELADLGVAIVHPSGAVLSGGAGVSGPSKAKKAAWVGAKALEVGQMESGVLAVDTIKDKKDKKGKKKDKKKDKEEDKDRDPSPGEGKKGDGGASAVDRARQVLGVQEALFATSSHHTSVGAGGDSAW